MRAKFPLSALKAARVGARSRALRRGFWGAIPTFVFFLLVVCLAALPAGAAQNGYSLRTTGGPYSGPAFIGDVNSALQALASNNAGNTAPSSIFGPMTWINTSTSTYVIEMYDGAQWVPIGTLNTSTHMYSPYGAPLGFSALQVTNDATTPNTKIDIFASSLGLTNGTTSLTLFNVSLSGSTAINTAATGAGGMDVSALGATPAWVHNYVIYNGTTVAGLGTLTSPTSGLPTLPSTYTYYRYAGSMYWNGTALVASIQNGNHFTLDQFQIVNSGITAQGWAVQNLATFMPPTSTRVNLQVTMSYSATTPVHAVLRRNGSSAATGHFVGQVGANSQYSMVGDWIDTDSSQRVQLNVDGAAGWEINIIGFELNL
jgi:hypothetical protein